MKTKITYHHCYTIQQPSGDFREKYIQLTIRTLLETSKDKILFEKKKVYHVEIAQSHMACGNRRLYAPWMSTN